MRRKLAFQKILLPAVGSFFAIFLCMELLLISGQMLVISPFGATCVIAFVIPGVCEKISVSLIFYDKFLGWRMPQSFSGNHPALAAL